MIKDEETAQTKNGNAIPTISHNGNTTFHILEE